MTTPRRRPKAHRKSRVELGIELKRTQKQLGSVLIAIDTAMRTLNYRIDRSVQQCQPRGSGSIVGSVVQVPQANPAHEDHFDFLESVRKTLEDLVRESP